MKTKKPKPEITAPMKRAIISVHKMWSAETKVSQETNNSWHKLDYRQALRDCLEAFKRQGLVSDYSLDSISFTF